MEGILEFTPEVKPLQSISATRFTALPECALREVWAANGVAQLLPSSPAARLGSMIHRLLQEAGEGRFISGGKASIENRWRELVGAAEQAMRDTWLERHLAPLKDSVPDFEVRRIQACGRALEIAIAAARVPKGTSIRRAESEAEYGFELALSSPDGLVRGKIDAVLPSVEGPVIRDYKSGAIFESNAKRPAALRASYEAQLRLYAALYASSRGRWPARLEVVPLAGEAQPVTFDEMACSRLLGEARAALQKVNSVIREAGRVPTELQRRLATPAPTNCAYCPYRPGCTPYQSAAARSGGGWPKDLWGQVEGIRQLGNSKVVITLRAQVGLARVRGLTADTTRHPALEHLHPGDDASVFNLKVAGSDNSFLQSQFTVIYKMPGALGTGLIKRTF